LGSGYGYGSIRVHTKGFVVKVVVLLRMMREKGRKKVEEKEREYKYLILSVSWIIHSILRQVGRFPSSSLFS